MIFDTEWAAFVENSLTLSCFLFEHDIDTFKPAKVTDYEYNPCSGGCVITPGIFPDNKTSRIQQNFDKNRDHHEEQRHEP